MSKRTQPVTYPFPTIPLSLMFIIFFSFILFFSHTAFDPHFPAHIYLRWSHFSSPPCTFSLYLSLAHCGCLGILCSFITSQCNGSNVKNKKACLPFPLLLSPSKSLISLLLDLVIVPPLASTILSKYISDSLC